MLRAPAQQAPAAGRRHVPLPTWFPPPCMAWFSLMAPGASRWATIRAGPIRRFDDSTWPTVTLDKSLAEQGFESYAGFAWYRLRIQPQQLQLGAAGNAPLHLLIASHSVGQLAVYVNGVEVGHSRGMTDSPRMYESPPFDVVLPPAGGRAPIEVAVRSWAAPGLPISHGLLDRVEAGARTISPTAWLSPSPAIGISTSSPKW